MRNDLPKFIRALTNLVCFSLILISNNSELAAKYLLNKGGELYKSKTNIFEINQDELFDILITNE